MPNETILQIQKAEQEAQGIRDKAKATAGDMIAEAKKTAAARKERAEAAANREWQDTLSAMRRKADDLADKSSADAQAEAERLTQKAEGNLSKAVKKIVWEIVENVSL